MMSVSYRKLKVVTIYTSAFFYTNITNSKIDEIKNINLIKNNNFSYYFVII